MKRAFLAGFLTCYAIAGLDAGCNAALIPPTTRLGAVYAGVMWLPLNNLPAPVAERLVPAWAFDFKEGQSDGHR